MAQLPRST